MRLQKTLYWRFIPGGSYPSFRIEKVAKFVSRKLAMTIDDDFVGRGTYGRCLYDKVPYCVEGSKFFNSLDINYEAGDSVLLVGDLKNKAPVSTAPLSLPKGEAYYGW